MSCTNISDYISRLFFPESRYVSSIIIFKLQFVFVVVRQNRERGTYTRSGKKR